ncbi:hypothetical protein QAD02_010550 [Eretmocerus hayati]|uniref:Uncharacterized protein n=1 Tax=Eretmocerus hayati TaxID=131215 RepID=A0ACC2NWV0_9HYME|nr:hypothetical protein QAD02_010550 [Eretmocerus hayati]
MNPTAIEMGENLESSKGGLTKEHETEVKDIENEDRIFESCDINESEHDAIKGDTVGETLYSAKWILNTLISLSQIYESGWNESIEHDLCTLWDMSAEPDIVKFLMQNDFFKMAEFTLQISEEPRLTEIIVGIVGNMSCNSEALQSLVTSVKLVPAILSLISSDDKETILQVLRIIQSVIWDVQNNPESPWVETLKECKIIGESIPFILTSSTSEELLASTIEVVYSITELESDNGNILVDIFDIDQLILALCEAMREIIDQRENSHSEIQLKCIENWLNIMFNIMKRDLLKITDDENDESFQKITSVLSQILSPYEIMSNMMPLEDQCAICIHLAIKMILSFQKCDIFPDSRLFSTIMKLMVNLSSAAEENEFGGCDKLRSLFEYTGNYWTETLKTVGEQKIVELLSSCDGKTTCMVLDLSKSLPGITRDSETTLAKIKFRISTS